MEIGKFCKACKDNSSGDDIPVASICEKAVNNGQSASCDGRHGSPNVRPV